jgi:hypothetical protein
MVVSGVSSRRVRLVTLNYTAIVRHHLIIGGAFLMAKFTAEEKLNAGKRYLNSMDGQRSKSIGPMPGLVITST